MTPGPGLNRTPLPKNFLACGLNCGVRRYRPDVGLILSTIPSVAVGVFTQNSYPAHPVQYCRNILPSNNIKAIITNSGQANAGTGKEGNIRNILIVKKLAEELQCSTDEILIASTGLIGVQVEHEKINNIIPALIKRASNVAESFALSILTTDLVPKSVVTEVELSEGKIMITGICKGSGMIHPNMATMLGYILTDIKLDQTSAKEYLKEACDLSFNMISVDGETSTNDSVFLLANGSANIKLINEEDKNKFKKALNEVCKFLAKSIVKDGEGATKLIEYQIKGASSLEEAKKIARHLSLSPLIKTALYGEDLNWGRIICRLGSFNIPNKYFQKLCLKIQNHIILRDGTPINYDESMIENDLKKDTITISVDFNIDNYEAIAWSSDLSKKYVEINAEYTT